MAYPGLIQNNINQPLRLNLRSVDGVENGIYLNRAQQFVEMYITYVEFG